MNDRVLEPTEEFAAALTQSAQRACDASVLHVAGRITEAVFSFLGPTTEALQRVGVPQTVMLIDAPGCRERLARFAEGVEIVAVAERRPALRHWVGLRQRLRERLAQHMPTAVHFHGRGPWLAGAGLVRHADTSVFVSPHGAPLRRALLASREVALATSVFDLHHLEAAGIHPLFVEGAIDDAFFKVQKHEARRPLIVGGCHRENHRAVEHFCRTAVIFGDALGVDFNWFGPVDESDAALLKAAGVGTWPALADAAVASRLGAGWVFVASGGEPDFPVVLVQAMAAGLPCLVAESPAYADLIHHDVSGLVYRNDDEAIALLTALIDDAGLRRRLGVEASAQARRRFTRQRLENELMWVYSR